MQNEASRFNELTTEECMELNGGATFIFDIIAGFFSITVGIDYLVTTAVEDAARKNAEKDWKKQNG